MHVNKFSFFRGLYTFSLCIFVSLPSVSNNYHMKSYRAYQKGIALIKGRHHFSVDNIQIFSRRIITEHIAPCKSNTRRIRIWCCDCIRRRKGSHKLPKWYRPNQQYLTKYRTIVYKCRQYGVKNIFLSRLTITNKLSEQLIKDFNISICNICSQTPNCDYIDNANTTQNEVCRDGLHLSGKDNYVLIKNYLDKVWKFFLEIVQHPRMGTLVWMKDRFCRTIYKYWKISY